MWLLSPKAEAQTWPHTVQADPWRVVVGCGWVRCWCLRARFATATSICCCSKVTSPLSQTARHSSRSPANSSSLSKEIPDLLGRLNVILKTLLLTPHRTSAAEEFTIKEAAGSLFPGILITWPSHLSCLLSSIVSRHVVPALRRIST